MGPTLSAAVTAERELDLRVARMDHAQARLRVIGARVVEGVEQRIVIGRAGRRPVEAVAQEGFDRGFGGGQTRHGDGLRLPIKARPVRLILFALFLVGAVALAGTLLAWLAERRLDRMAEAWSFADVARVPSVDVALVLGTAPIGPEGGPNRYFVYRLDAAAALWKAGKAKYFIVSGSGQEPTAMRAGLVERGVPAEAIYLDPAGYRTWDSVLRARDVYGQKRIVIVSQRFHLDRALFLAREAGVEAWGLEARDVDTPYSVFTELRRFPSALRAYYDIWTDAKARESGKKIAIGVDPPS
jgi:SanA protein